MTSTPGIPLPREGSLSEAQSAEAQRTKIILVGLGGATCSGKTTLAKHLRNILPDSFIIHQDDFAPHSSLLPVHPTLGQDWDSAPTAIDYPRLRSFLATVKLTASIPADHASHDHLNEQKVYEVGTEVREKWRDTFRRLQKKLEGEKGEKVKWGLVDGFLLYWDEEVAASLDAKFFLRVPYAELKVRRENRSGYYTAENTFWKDPPGYFDELVYPAYVDAHRKMFEDGDVEHGKPTMPGLQVIDPLGREMGDLVEECCRSLEGLLTSVVAEGRHSQ